MRAVERSFVLGLAAALVLAGAPARAQAALDNEVSMVDASNRTMTVQQWNTVLDGVPALDRNRLTREWFESGRADYHVVGANSDQFAGQLELGYQIGFPWTLGVDLNFRYTTPNILLDKTTPAFRRIITPNLFPGVAISANLGSGPGLQEIVTFSVDVSGPDGSVAVSGAHGTVTGVAGGVIVRPLARLLSKGGDIVTTYGEPWNMG